MSLNSNPELARGLVPEVPPDVLVEPIPEPCPELALSLSKGLPKGLSKGRRVEIRSFWFCYRILQQMQSLK